MNINVYLRMLGGSLSIRACCKYGPPFLMAVKKTEQVSVTALAVYLHELRNVVVQHYKTLILKLFPLMFNYIR